MREPLSRMPPGSTQSTTKRVNRQGGKVTTTQTAVVSADEKTMTITTKGTNAQGQTVNNVEAYDEQSAH